MKLDSNTAIIINSEMREETEKVLMEFNLTIDRKIIGDYICYLFIPSGKDPSNWKWQNYFSKYQESLYWAGMAPIKKSLKSYSQVLYSYGLKLQKEGNLENAVNYYKKSLEAYPRNCLARESLVNYYGKNGPVAEYKKELLKLKHLCLPYVKKAAEFKNGMTFLGYRIFRHNDILRIDYYWKTSRKLSDYTVVFVYFIKDGKIVFQGDYPLSFEYPNPIINLRNWVFIERSRVYIPKDIESGKYEIQIGLYMPDKGGRRIRAKDLETKITIGEFTL